MAEQQQQQELEKPKRAKTSYMCFSDEKRSEVLEAHRAKGKVNMVEIGKELSRLWSELGETEKAKYQAMAAEHKAQHDKAMQEYIESTKIEGLMKRPQSGYFQFINACRANIMADFKISAISEVGKKAAELWKAMDAEEKKPYEEQYQKDKAVYETWKISDAGKEALVKQKSMKKGAKAPAEQTLLSPKKLKGDKTQKETPTKSPNKAKRGRPASPASNARVAKVARKAKAADSTAKTQLSQAVLSKCAEMGYADTGVSYKSLLERLLSADGLASVDPEKALDALKTNGGLLNKTRTMLQAM